MVYQYAKRILALDIRGEYENPENEEEKKVKKFPKNIIKMIKKYKNKARIKIIILHDSDLHKSDLFEPKFLEECEDHLDFMTSTSDFWFKVGLALSHRMDVWMFSSEFCLSKAKIKEKMKFLMFNDPLKVDMDTVEDFGKLEIYPFEEMEDFAMKKMRQAEEDHFKECFPKRARIEEEKSFKPALEEITKKISKQFSNVRETDLAKFINTCSNVVKQHIASSKFEAVNRDDFKDCMLVYVLEKLVDDQIVESDGIIFLCQNLVYLTKQFDSILRVTLNSSMMKGNLSSKIDSLMNNTSGSINVQEHAHVNTSITSSMCNSTFDKTHENQDESKVEETSIDEKLGEIKIVNLEMYNLSETDGEKLFNFVLTSFYRKYEQSAYSNIKRKNKFINAMENLVKQNFLSKKFKKRFGDIDDEDLLSSVAVKLLQYLQIHEIIKIEDTRIEHDESKFSACEKEFHSLYGS